MPAGDTIRVVDPTRPTLDARGALAPRQAKLRGTIGLLSNGKPNATMLLQALEERLRDYGVTEFLWLDKSRNALGPSQASPEWMIQRLTSGTVAVLAASGD